MSRPSSGYVLKFISGKYQGGEFPIEIGQEVLIGRSSDLDMVLVEDMVSRQHSRILTENGDLYIEDLGSTNGTFVNGEKINKKQLKEGDRILVGTNIIKLVAANEAGPPPQQPFGGPRHGNDPYQTHSSAPSVTQTQVFRTVQQGGQSVLMPPGPVSNPVTYSGEVQAAPPAAFGSPNAIMTGSIDELPLPDLLQLFSTTKRDGVLMVQSERDGRIYLRGGRVYFALIMDRPDAPPDKAFYRMLAWSSGRFALEPPTGESFEDELNASTEALMMEGMRLLDEMRNMGEYPPNEANLLIEQPLMPPLRALTPELLDTLQLIHNFAQVETILNQSLASDLETLQDIVYLMRNEYVRLV